MNIFIVLLLLGVSLTVMLINTREAIDNLEQQWKKALLFILTMLSLIFLGCSTLLFHTLYKQPKPEYQQIQEPLYRKL